jgi:hypothetical protein
MNQRHHQALFSVYFFFVSLFFFHLDNELRILTICMQHASAHGKDTVDTGACCKLVTWKAAVAPRRAIFRAESSTRLPRIQYYKQSMY